MSLAILELGDVEMVPFTLRYEGILHSSQAKKADGKRERHAMRLAFHQQLPRLWKLHPRARGYANRGWTDLPNRGQTFLDGAGRIVRRDYDWAKTVRRNLDFIPFVIRGANLTMVCELDIR